MLDKISSCVPGFESQVHHLHFCIIKFCSIVVIVLSKGLKYTKIGRVWQYLRKYNPKLPKVCLYRISNDVSQLDYMFLWNSL